MAQDQLEKEIRELRAQVEELTSAQAQREKAEVPAPQSGRVEQSSQVRGTLERALEGVKDAELEKKLADYLKELGSEIAESKRGPLIAAFLAGFVAGRLTGGK